MGIIMLQNEPRVLYLLIKMTLLSAVEKEKNLNKEKTFVLQDELKVTTLG